MSAPPRPKPARKSSAHHRTTLSLQKTEVKIHVYDLLPPGKVSTMLWAIGSALLHSAVVIGDREYNYGGHEQRGVTGVYCTRPGQPPPGGTFRQAILHGFSFRPEEEMNEIIQEASRQFLGPSYNLLTRNCNHFTSYLCEKLTGRPAPSWINRAASIGVALPCIVPKEWVCPPDHDTAEGELLDEDFEDERSSMLQHEQRRRLLDAGEGSTTRNETERSASSLREYSWHPPGDQAPRIVKDTNNREIPPAERAPLPRRIT